MTRAALFALLAAVAAFGQTASQLPRPQAGPTPHLADGKPDFGGNGVWNPHYTGNMAETKYHGAPGVDAKVDVPFLPWAQKLFDERQVSQAKDDPEARCMPAGLPRYMFTPYPFEMIQTGKRVIFLYEGSAHIWRSVPIGDNLKHPADPNPTWMGDSIGRWEGDTLVIDVVGFNDKAWLDQAGHPHTEALHLIERFTRTDALTLKYQVTVDDPKTYSRPWTTSLTIPYLPGGHLMEYICQEDNVDVPHMVGK
jgi:hypothetical protein